MGAHQQRAKTATRSAGVGIPPDNELLVAGTLDLEPVAAALLLVAAVSALADYAFEPHLTGALIKSSALAIEMVAVTKGACMHVGSIEQGFECARSEERRVGNEW